MPRSATKIRGGAPQSRQLRRLVRRGMVLATVARHAPPRPPASLACRRLHRLRRRPRPAPRRVQVDCGTLLFDNVQEQCPDTAAALDCFDRSPRPHIEQVFISVEGDPIYEHFFADSERAILIRDTRADAWGPQEVTRSECAGGIAESAPTVSGCLHVVCSE